MIIKDITYFQNARQNPVILYLPDNFAEMKNIKSVIFGSGFQGQDRFEDGFYCKNYTYLAKFFTDKSYAFISVQFEVPGDKDELPNLAKGEKIDQIKERTPLWIKDEKIILFIIEKLKEEYATLNLDKFIIAGHSNGADVAKFFANRHSEKILNVISIDGRRCPISPFVDLKVLMFEANDTTTDKGIIPGENGYDPLPGEREKTEYVVVKPKNAMHRSYKDSGEDIVKKQTCSAIDWFLNTFV